MEFKQLLTDDRAVSPVIGVILMVAITVILAAVIGTFVLGLGNNLGDTAPNANFEFSYSDSDTAGLYNVSATHQGGATIDSDMASSLNVTAEGGNGTEGPYFNLDAGVSTGDTAYLDKVAPGTGVSVVWTSPDGSQSQAIAEGSTPGN